MDTLQNKPSAFAQSMLTQLLALAAIENGGELRFPMDDLKTMLDSPEDGLLYIDIDKENGQIIVKTVRSLGGTSN